MGVLRVPNGKAFASTKIYTLLTFVQNPAESVERFHNERRELFYKARDFGTHVNNLENLTDIK